MYEAFLLCTQKLCLIGKNDKNIFALIYVYVYPIIRMTDNSK